MKVVLELQDQPSNIKKVTIRHDIVIGRGVDCNLRLSAPQVSRRHCFLRVGADGASVTDLDSSNGTWVNGEKISSGQRCLLEDGTTLSVGPVKFVARVLSDVELNEELQVELVDQRLQAHGHESESDDGVLDATATITEDPVDDDASNLNFSIEHGGESGGDDEPTADYVAGDSGNNFFADIEEPGPDEDLPLLVIDDDEPEPETVAVTGDEIIDEVEIIEDAAQDDDEILIIEDDLVIEDDDAVLDEDAADAVELVDDVVVVDEVEIVEDPVVQDEEAELKDFLKGLD